MSMHYVYVTLEVGSIKLLLDYYCALIIDCTSYSEMLQHCKRWR